MSDQAGSVDRMTAGDPGRGPVPKWVDEPIVRVRDVLPFVPNVLATFAGFLVLLIAPWICLKIHEIILEDASLGDRGSNLLESLELDASAIIAVVGSSLFLMIGIILQAWQHRRPFSSQWPVVLAFPIVMALIVPEALLRGFTFFTGVVVGAAIAVAFGVHWVALVILREELD
jgi:hypothetical protein